MEENEIFDIEKLNQLLEEKKYSQLVRELDEIPPVDAAEFLASLPENRAAVIFRMLKKDSAAEIFAELDPDLQTKLVGLMTDREVKEIYEELYVDDAVDTLEEMPANVVKRILQLATPQTRAEINRFLAYPEDSAGSVMTSEFIDLKKNMTCEQAIAHIRKTGLDKETVYVAYVTDKSRVLQGVVPLKQLLFAKPDDVIEDIMNPNVIFAHTSDDQETVANMISHYDLIALPIVDNENRLVGLVTVDDALDVLEAEATEDIEKMAAILPTDKPYFKTGVFETWKKRIPWLLLLMISATFTSMIIRNYESKIAHVAILTAFFPMLMDTGGNAGGQTSVTIIRSLSLGEVHLRDVFRVIWKEFRVACLCGLTIAAATFIKVFAIDFKFQASTMLEGNVLQNNLIICAVVCITVFFAIVVAKLVGAILPIGAKRLGFDPAVMASPFITTIVDAVTLMIYFAVASMLLANF
ncbi:MAG: magnesium transporter [Ruminococcaceae bacterium]|nr:magnesium transporter [Oscillospiraceae bacterium]